MKACVIDVCYQSLNTAMTLFWISRLHFVHSYIVTRCLCHRLVAVFCGMCVCACVWRVKANSFISLCGRKLQVFLFINSFDLFSLIYSGSSAMLWMETVSQTCCLMKFCIPVKYLSLCVCWTTANIIRMLIIGSMNWSYLLGILSLDKCATW